MNPSFGARLPEMARSHLLARAAQCTIAAVLVGDALANGLTAASLAPPGHVLDANEIATRQLLVPIGQLVSLATACAWLLACVAFLCWIHSAYRTAAALGEAPTGFTPGGAVASFFIPFANLVRPYLAVKALFGSSDPQTVPDAPVAVAAGDHYRDVRAPEVPSMKRWSTRAPLGAWWAAWVGMNVSALAAPAVLPMGPVVVYLVVRLATTVVAGVLAIRVVQVIDGRQRERARRVAMREPLADAAFSASPARPDLR